jgi:hypothetical protein
MEEIRVSNRIIIGSIAGTIYEMHPYKRPENMDKIMDKVVSYYEGKIDSCGHKDDNFKLFNYDSQKSLLKELNILLNSIKEFRQLNISKKLKDLGVDDIDDDRNSGFKLIDRYTIDNKDSRYSDFIDLDACMRNIVNEILNKMELSEDCMFCKFATEYGSFKPSECDKCKNCSINPKLKFNRISHPLSLKPKNKWTKEEIEKYRVF